MNMKCVQGKKKTKQNKRKNIISKKCEQKTKNTRNIKKKIQREKENSRIVFGLRHKQKVC